MRKQSSNLESKEVVPSQVFHLATNKRRGTEMRACRKTRKHSEGIMPSRASPSKSAHKNTAERLVCVLS